MKKGFFISIEGGEGAGKSVQAEILKNRLTRDGYKVVITREPGGTRIGEQIRSITHNTENVDLSPVAEAYLMAASRAQHVSEIIKPALDAGKIVISDRYLDSSLVYQGYGRQLGEENVRELNRMAVGEIIPDLTILLNVTPETGLERRHGSMKAKDRLDLQGDEFYHRVYEAYLAIAKNNPLRYVVLDAGKSIEETASSIWNSVAQRIKKSDGQ